MARRASWPRAALVVLLLASIIAACDPFAQATASPEPTEPPGTPTPTRTATPEPTTAPAAAPTAPEGPTEEAVVVRVVDGDSIEVEIDGQTVQVRYIGIDAPEFEDENGQEEPLARQAAAANRGLVADKMVLLEQDVSEVDQFGRLLRYVWVDVNGTLRLVNHILLARGFAQLLTIPPDVRYVEAFQAAETAARERGAGLWASDADADTDDASPTPEPEAEETPAPSPIVEDEEIAIGEGQTAFRGGPGSYRWTAITFTSPNNFVIRWSATSTSGACTMEWSLVGANSAFGNASRTEPGQANGRGTLSAPNPGTSELTVDSDCRKWLITFNEVPPPPTPAPTPEPTPEPTAGPSAEASAEPSAGASAEPSPST